MELQNLIPSLISPLEATAEVVSPASAYIAPDWQQAQELLNARFSRHDSTLQRTHQHLDILSKFVAHLPRIETTEMLINAALNNDTAILARLETTRTAMHLIEWQTAILALSSGTYDPELIPLEERPVEANFFVADSPRFFERSAVNSQLLDQLVVEKSEHFWRFENCPELSSINTLWFQRFGQDQRAQVFEAAMHYIDSLPAQMNPIGLNLIGRAIYNAIDDVRFESLPTDRRSTVLIADFLRLKADIEEIMRMLNQSEESLEPEKKDIIELAQSSEIDMAIQCLAAERVISDFIRHSVIPDLVAKEAPCAQSYWEIHRARFSSTPAAIQNFGDAPFTLHEYTRSSSRQDFYSRNIGNLRDINVVCEGSFTHLYHSHLPTLSERFFAALEAGLKNPPDSRDQLIEQLCLTQAFLTLSHLPFDGAGRTNEDFLVFYAKRMGVDFSLSNSGYRHHLSPLADEFQKIEIRFKYEFDRNTILSLGIIPGKFDEDRWIDRVDNLLDSIHPSGSKGFQVQKSLKSVEFISALEGDPGARQRVLDSFPSLTEMRELFSRALDETYLQTAPELALNLDRGIARSMVTPPWQFRYELLGERKRYQGNTLGEIFLKEHLEKRSWTFVSEKLRTEFDQIYKKLSRPS